MYVVLFGERDGSPQCYVSPFLENVQTLVGQFFAKKPPKICGNGEEYWAWCTVQAEQSLKNLKRGESVILANDVEVYWGHMV